MNSFENIFKNYKPYINSSESYKISSVIIPLIKINDIYYILFEVRSAKLNSYPNEVCFPGGKIDKGECAKSAAIRETCEELGLCNDELTVITALDLFISPVNMIIHPFLAMIKDINNIKLNKEEVEDVFLVPLSFFLNTTPKFYTNTVEIKPGSDFPYYLLPQKNSYKFKTGFYETLFYQYNDYIIWGITARILYNFIQIIKTAKEAP